MLAMEGSSSYALKRPWTLNCLRSPYCAVSAIAKGPLHAVKVAGMTVIAMLLTLRAARLFVRFDATTALVLSSAGLIAWLFGVTNTLCLLLISVSMYFAFLLKGVPTANAGHRVGGHGFDGPRPENTLEALRDLIRRDNAAPLGDLSYAEFDVHETKDGEIVVFHDDTLARAVSDTGLNAAPAAALRDAGLDYRTATIQQLTCEQLGQFHLGGQPGVLIPTLRQFLRCCSELQLQRTIAVEVKSIVTETGRFSLLHQMRDYTRERNGWLQATCPERQYAPFQWAAVIAFSHTWARSFGEFGSGTWRRWGCLFKENRIPVRACVFHSLNLVYDADC